MDCDNCRAIAKQLRAEEGNQLNIPGNGGRRGSTPWSAPCSRKSSCPGPGLLGKWNFRRMILFLIDIIYIHRL